ncbi:hypothetical protein AALO_G00155080, partial [Alosa alosa]
MLSSVFSCRVASSVASLFSLVRRQGQRRMVKRCLRSSSTSILLSQTQGVASRSILLSQTPRVARFRGPTLGSRIY